MQSLMASRAPCASHGRHLSTLQPSLYTRQISRTKFHTLYTASKSNIRFESIIAQARRTPHRKSTRGKQEVIEDQDGNLVEMEPYSDDEVDAESEPAEGALSSTVLDSIIKVYTIHSEPNHSLPWQRKRQYSSTSSGFVIHNRMILTNAHSVEYHTQVKLKKRGDDGKFLARVLAIGVECDMALLTVDDEDFWRGLTPLHFGQLPKLQDPVLVVGYPIGGDTLSITSGVVSRIEVTPYVHGSMELLGMQIDAAINSGNSGGAVLDESGKCVGIAFQSLVDSDAENIGYVIPTPVVRHFLTDYARHGRYTGFPMLGVHWQRLESASLRQMYGLADGRKGVLVRRVNPTAAAAQVLQRDDVILKFDGIQVANDGTVPFRTGERIAFGYLVSQRFTGDQVTIDLWRQGEEHRVKLPLSRPTLLVPVHTDGRDPSYIILAGLVFTPCTKPYLEGEYGDEYETDAPVRLLQKLYHEHPLTPDQQVVVLSQVLACEATFGYEELHNTEINAFNGVKIRNIFHLAELVEDERNKGAEFWRFDLDYEEVVAIKRTDAERSMRELLAAHSIPAMASRDVEEHLARRRAERGEPIVLVEGSGREVASVGGVDKKASESVVASVKALSGKKDDAKRVVRKRAAKKPSSSSSSSSSSPSVLPPPDQDVSNA